MAYLLALLMSVQVFAKDRIPIGFSHEVETCISKDKLWKQIELAAIDSRGSWLWPQKSSHVRGNGLIEGEALIVQYNLSIGEAEFGYEVAEVIEGQSFTYLAQPGNHPFEGGATVELERNGEGTKVLWTGRYYTDRTDFFRRQVFKNYAKKFFAELDENLEQAEMVECNQMGVAFFTERDAAVSDLYKNFQSLVALEGGNLIVELQNNDSKNASASRHENDWVLSFGGAIVKSYLSDEAFRLLLCHELGHHLGGAPFKFAGDSQYHWVSAEGQADYFAGRYCAEKMISNLSERESAAEELANYWWKKKRKRVFPPPSLQRKSQKVVEATLLKHPSAQCRLDTFLAAFSCSGISDCRPACWFRAD